eukprot:4482631-Pleurochrysis_carterae.AAC.4
MSSRTCQTRAAGTCSARLRLRSWRRTGLQSSAARRAPSRRAPTRGSPSAAVRHPRRARAPR